ncbi:MAG TPA: YidC/Oxa1 family membrane protein insertase [Ktedonobacteraceae bacterium]|nr:YidC/Oxa1 family membrane protein insertase [Ktedonobacteraceae bacterium]
MGEIGYIFNILFTFPIYNILMLLDHVFGDFGLSIIVLTLLIRLALFPLTLKQLRSTKATQAIQPLMADLKKKYANDQRAQYAAMQALYKEYNINPMAGCLPLLVQMPVLYGLYYAMRVVLTPGNGQVTIHDVNQYIYPFLPKFTSLPSFDLRWFTFINPHWSLSLAQPDITHILPILAGLATFVQLRMSQARTQTSGQKDMMTQQMQLMSYIMPFVTIFIAWSFPAGLALYWTTSSIFSMVQQYFVTGWGSLFTTPALSFGKTGTNNGSTYVGDSPKEQTLLKDVVDSDAEVLPERNTRANGYSNSPSVRRRRPNSASARRRGTAPRRNPSRS